MSSLKSPFRSPLSRALRSAFAGVGVSAPAMPTTLAAAIALAEAGFSHLGTGNITTSLVSNRAYESNTGVAPYGVQFDATGTTTALTANPFHDLIYIMHFGDDDAATWSYGTRPGVSKRNLARGAVSAHVFETPGTRTVKCTPMCLSSGGVLSVGATQSITITAQDPDVVFAGTNTICIGKTTPAPTDPGVPSGASRQSATTWGDVLTIVRANPQKRILVNADGSTWTNNDTGNVSVAGPGIIGTYGSGAKPIISYAAAARSAFNAAAGFVDWRIMGFESNASALATGSARNATRFFGALDGPSNNAGQYCTLINNEHHHAGTFALLGDDCIVADCNTYALDGGGGNVGIWCYQRNGIAVLGTAIDDASLMEMNLRFQGVRKAVISNCKLKDPIANGTKHALALRGWSDASASYAWTGVYTEEVIVSDNEISGVSASGLVQIASQNGSSDERHRNIIVERNYIKCLTNYGVGLTHSASKTTIRNNLFEAVNGPEYAITISNSPATSTNGSAVLPPIDGWLYNNTFYSASTVTHAGRFTWLNSATSTGISLKNNVVYLPGYTGAKGVVLAAGGASYTASNNTPDANIASVSPQFAVTPPTTYAEWRPGSGSYAGNSGTWVPVFDAFDGAAREGTMDMGAFTQ